jgi:hypothetical protein
MPTTELKELCVLAYERQLLALDKQGEKGKLVSTLKAEMKEVRSGRYRCDVILCYVM